MFLILFSYVNFCDSGARSGRTGVFGKEASKKSRGPEVMEPGKLGVSTRKGACCF